MLLKLTDIAKTYTAGNSRVHVFSDINMQVEQGDFLSIMGTSGSGKSTLLHILGTLLSPDNGRYILNGKKIHTLQDKELAWLRAHWIGYVFQTFDLIAEQSIRENIALPYLYRQNISTKEINKQVDYAIDVVGLRSRREHKPSELSGGEMQRAAIARAVAIKPKLILADEPTGNLDENNSIEIMTLFQKLNDGGTTIILVTHDSSVAKKTKQTLIMKNGKLSKL